MARTGDWRRRALLEARLLVIVGAPPAGRAVEEVVAASLRGGARLFELRAKSLQPEGSGRGFLSPGRSRAKGEAFALARRLAEACALAGALLLVNDDADVALASGADGVHVGQEDLPPAAARRVVGGDLLVGLSVHDAAEAAAAASARRARDLDYVGLGTIFASPSKPDLRAQGPEGLRALLPSLRGIPGFAIGGITAANAAGVLATGVHGVAAASAIEGAEDVERATREMLRALA